MRQQINMTLRLLMPFFTLIGDTRNEHPRRMQLIFNHSKWLERMEEAILKTNGYRKFFTTLVTTPGD